MNYIFKDTQLIWSGAGIRTVPHQAYMYSSDDKSWWWKGDRNYLRPVKPKHVPKSIKTLCLILGIPI